jgi:hypothetical protein
MENSPSIGSSSTLSETFKLKKSTTFRSKAPRLLEGLEYQHLFSESEFQMKMINYLNNKQWVEKNLCDMFDLAIETKTNKFIPKSMFDAIEASVQKIKCLPVLYYAIMKNFENTDEEETITEWASLCEWDLKFVTQQKQEMFTNFPQVREDNLEDVISGRIKLSPSAVMTVMNCLEKVAERIIVHLDNLSKKSPEESYRQLILYSIKLGYCFEFLYGSFIVDQNSVFYTDSNPEDTEILNRWLTVVDPENLDKHLKKLESAATNIGFFIGIAQKGFQHKTNMKKLLSFAYYGTFYILKRKTGSNNGLMFLHSLDSKVLTRMIQFPENKIIQKVMKITLSKIEVDKTIYVPISHPDQLTRESYTETEQPYMVTHRQGMRWVK